MLGQQDQPAGKVPMEATIDYAENDGPTVLGDRLNNPYTIENMTAAKAYLTGEGIVSENNFDVRVTHYYVKFIPRTEYELEQLWQDSTLNLYDCPLDYDKVVVGKSGAWPTMANRTIIRSIRPNIQTSLHISIGV
jgi:hypothetical protein